MIYSIFCIHSVFKRVFSFYINIVIYNVKRNINMKVKRLDEMILETKYLFTVIAKYFVFSFYEKRTMFTQVLNIFYKYAYMRETVKKMMRRRHT